MQHRFFACYYSNSPKVDIILRIGFENYEEMSESAKKEFKSKKITFPFYINTKVTYNYQYLVGDLLLYENFYPYFFELFEATSNRIVFLQQLYFTKKDCINYVLRNCFTKDFFEIFASNRLLNLYRKVAKAIDFSGSSLKIEHLNIDDIKSDFVSYYESNNIRDIVFSTVHFALENGYKFTQCQHCGKWFFKSSSRKDSNTKYCKRNSPVPDYAHLNCEQAVRNIKQQCARVKNRIETKIQLAEKGTYSYFIIDFQNQCEVYKDKIKECPTVENLTDYMSFLDKVEKDREWINNG